MKVKAKKQGYMFDRRIKEGEVFDIKDEKMFSDKWMTKLAEGSEEKTKVKKVPVPKPVPLSQAHKANESFEEESDKPTGSKEVI